ncbi:DUF1189 domain-containing protein [Jeotgalibacillus sp. R-1-5s-1]|uniref:DUF1189 domain-containing protein n=1 Tax=Jeotgalibacillus sp. R-1-5s-1 TaxID=2555897 RepID=UPI00141A73C0|nr:DUF1189 domain-containing protein [Jeotgalibacillus sp. R-1-5s-1]
MNIFKQFYKSLYSPKDISRFRFQGIGKTILYLFILAFISSIPAMIQIISLGNTVFNEGEEILSNQMPAFEVTNGTLQTETNEEVTIRNSGFTIIVDGTGEMTSEDIEGTVNTAALLRDGVAVSAGAGVQEYPYSSFTGFTFSNEGLSSLLSSIEGAKVIIYAFIFLFIYIIGAGLLFIKTLFFAWIGTIMAKSSERRLVYRQSFRLAAYSSTLPVTFFLITDIVGSVIPFATLINWFVTTMVLYLAIKEIPQPKKKPEVTA